MRGSILRARLAGYWLHFACVFPAVEALIEIATYRPFQLRIRQEASSALQNLTKENISALGQIGDSRAVEVLIKLLIYSRIKQEAVIALQQLTKENIGINTSAWEVWWKDHKKEYSAD